MALTIQFHATPVVARASTPVSTTIPVARAARWPMCGRGSRRAFGTPYAPCGRVRRTRRTPGPPPPEPATPRAGSPGRCRSVRHSVAASACRRGSRRADQRSGHGERSPGTSARAVRVAVGVLAPDPCPHHPERVADRAVNARDEALVRRRAGQQGRRERECCEDERDPESGQRVAAPTTYGSDEPRHRSSMGAAVCGGQMLNLVRLASRSRTRCRCRRRTAPAPGSGALSTLPMVFSSTQASPSGV